MDYKQAIQQHYGKLPDKELMKAYQVIREARNTALRIKHWRAIPELVDSVTRDRKRLATIRREAKKRNINLGPQEQARKPQEDFIQLGKEYFSPFYNVRAKLITTEPSSRVGTIYILQDARGNKYPTSRTDLERGRAHVQ